MATSRINSDRITWQAAAQDADSGRQPRRSQTDVDRRQRPSETLSGLNPRAAGATTPTGPMAPRSPTRPGEEELMPLGLPSVRSDRFSMSSSVAAEVPASGELSHISVSAFEIGESSTAALRRATDVASAGIAEVLVAGVGPELKDHLALCNKHGATREELDAFEQAFGAHFIPSASTGKNLASPNDHVGILKIPAYDQMPEADGRRSASIVAEQLAVVKAAVQNADPGQPSTERYFIKGYGDRLIDFGELVKAMLLHSPDPFQQVNPQDEAVCREVSPEAVAIRRTELCNRENCMETPLRSEIKRLSQESRLIARRDGKESDAPVMPLPPNATPMAWRENWANSEASMCPGAGPMLPNGTRKFHLDYNATENRLIIFRNDKGGEPRKTSIISDSLGQTKLAPAWCEGPMLAEIQGIKGWEDMGPATDHKGIKQGNTTRLLHALKEKVLGRPPADPDLRDLEEGAAYARPGAHIRITTEDGAVHDLKMDERGVTLSLANPQPANAHRESLAAFGGPGKVSADVDVYSYNGRDTGLYGSESGFADPKLITSTGEALKAGPLLKAHGSTLAQGALRLVTFQSLVNGQDRSRTVARGLNIALTAASKFFLIYGTAMANETLKSGRPGGTYMGSGVQQFNASGQGNVSKEQLALTVACIVVAQEAVTWALTTVGRMLPEPWKREPETLPGKAARSIVPMVEEMVRLSLNVQVQQHLGIHRGGWKDYASLAATSVAKGGIDKLREHAGSDPANHPIANTLLDLTQGVQYTAARAAGNAASSHQGFGVATFSEALINRLVTRGLDTIVVPPVKGILNSQGVAGPNASAFDSQLSHAYSIEGLTSKFAAAMKLLATELDVQGVRDLCTESGSLMATLHANAENALTGLVRKPGGTEFYSDRTLREERFKQQLNRIDLGVDRPSVLLPKLLQGMAQSLGLMRRAIESELQNDPSIRHNVDRAGSYADLEPEAKLAHLRATDEIFDRRVEAARALAGARAGAVSASLGPGAEVPEASTAASFGEGSPPLPPPSPPMTNSLSETATAQQRFTEDRKQAMRDHLARTDEAADHSNFRAPSMVDRPVPSAANVDYGRVQRPLGAGRSASIPRAQTTFSTLPQSKTYEKNRRMAAKPGMDSLTTKPDPIVANGSPFPADVKDRIEKAVRDYTVESQLFHYPLRWPVTGERQIEQIAPGIHVPYSVMHKRGNTAGSKKDKVDPIEALYINLGAHVSDKFPTEMFRAVVTEAAYKAQLEGGEARESQGLMTEGNMGVLTEIFSATMATQMAAGFNLPIANYLSAPRDQSLRIDLNQASGVNIAKWADLVQGEVIMLPGAVLQVAFIDKTAGRGSNAGAEAQDIGQVVYMKAVDTYELELAHDKYKAYERGDSGAERPPHGEAMIEPASGHFYKFNAELNGGLGGIEPVSEIKNYFTGRALENPSNLTEQARWRKPYTGDEATRTTKDAIHMAILRNDPIVPYLDLATENVHHAFFREKARMAGRLNEARDQAEAERKNDIRGRAQAIAQDIARMSVDTPLRGHGTDSTGMLAWLATSLLRKPIQLVPVEVAADGTVKLGDTEEGTVIGDTYDKVQLQNPKQSPTRNPEPAILIGVGENGYYAITHREGKFTPEARIGEGKTVGNLLHAVVRGGYARPTQYVEQAGVISPDTKAQASVDGLLQKMQQFAGTGYLVLQEAMVRKQAGLASAADSETRG